jgi:hypothetical protein
VGVDRLLATCLTPHPGGQSRRGLGCAMRQMSIMAVAFLLAGCGLAARQEQAAQEAARTAAQETFKARTAECNKQFPVVDKANAMARAQCVNRAFEAFLPVDPYPDLIRTLMAFRLAVVEQYQDGKITAVQANAAIAQKNSELAAEYQNRVGARQLMINNQRAAAAQAQAAAAQASAADDAELAERVAIWNAIRPHTCTYGSGMATCF